MKLKQEFYSEEKKKRREQKQEVGRETGSQNYKQFAIARTKDLSGKLAGNRLAKTNS